MYSLESKNSGGFITTDSIEEAEMYLDLGIAEYIEPDYTVELFSVPEDTLYSQQWHHSTISSQEAWDLEFYGDDIKIAVIDSGCYEHEDIADNLLDSYNYLNNSTDTTDSIGHGTRVSGIIAAEMNSFGVVGIANKAKIVPLKCFESNEDTKVSDVLNAVYDAVDTYSCRIINMSWGIDVYSQALYEAVNYAYNNGTILIAATGNNGTSTLRYPAAYDCVIGVGSISENNTVSSFSQHNSSVFAVAPGENILSLSTNGGYTSDSGTSYSTPMVTSLAAILMSIDDDMTEDEFKNCIINTFTDLGTSGYDTYYGYGLIGAGQAVRYMLSNEYCYISDITADDGKINFGVWNNTGSDITGILIAETFKGIYAYNIDTLQISLSSGETETYELNYSDDYDEIKCFIWDSLENMIPIDREEENTGTEINITSAYADSSGNINLECDVTNPADNQELTVMVIKYNDDAFDYSSITYYDQLDCSSGGGGGSSSSSATTTTTTEATTETTTYENTTETTSEETKITTEEDFEVTLNSSSSWEVSVTIGSNIISVNENTYTMEAAPYIQSGSNSTLVPLRFVAIAVFSKKN